VPLGYYPHDPAPGPHHGNGPEVVVQEPPNEPSESLLKFDSHDFPGHDVPGGPLLEPGESPVSGPDEVAENVLCRDNPDEPLSVLNQGVAHGPVPHPP